MKQVFSLSLILSLIFPTVIPLHYSIASEIELNESSESLFARGRGVGSRGGGGRRGGSRGGGRSINHHGLASRGSGRVNRDGRRRVNTDGRRRVNTEGYRRIERPNNRPANRPGNRPGNGGSFERSLL